MGHQVFHLFAWIEPEECTHQSNCKVLYTRHTLHVDDDVLAVCLLKGFVHET